MLTPFCAGLSGKRALGSALTLSLKKGNYERTVFGYLILISIDFWRFYFSVFSLVLVSIEKIYQTLKTVFDHISLPFWVVHNYVVSSTITLGGSWLCWEAHDHECRLIIMLRGAENLQQLLRSDHCYICWSSKLYSEKTLPFWFKILEFLPTNIRLYFYLRLLNCSWLNLDYGHD